MTFPTPIPSNTTDARARQREQREVFEEAAREEEQRMRGVKSRRLIMISNEQMQRAEEEFTDATRNSVEVARIAEHALENANYSANGRQPPQRIDELARAFNEADYMAESRAWILSLIREERQRIGSRNATSEQVVKMSAAIASPGNGLLGLGQHVNQ